MVGDRGPQAAQAEFHFLVVERPAVGADLVQRLPQGGRVGDGVGREPHQAVADECIQIGVRNMGEQHLAKRGSVRGRALADKGVHADQPRAVHCLYADRLAVVEDADMDGFTGVVGKVLQRRQRLPAQLLMPDGGRAEGVKAHGQRIAAGNRVFLEVPEFLDRVENTEHGRLALPQFGGEFGKAPGFLTGKAVQNLQPLTEGSQAIGITRYVIVVSHCGTMALFS